MTLIQQIWQGDSIELCEKFKPGRVDAVITDPPFGTDNQSNQAVTETGKAYARKILNDESPEQAIAVFTKVMNILVPKMRYESDIAVFTSYQVIKEWLVMCDDLFQQWDFTRQAVAPWVKDGPGMGNTKFPLGMGLEFILCYRRGNRELSIPRRNATLHFSQLRPQELIHPHEKPPGLMEFLVQALSDPGDFLVDPFGGSSSLARAARNTGRSAVTIEKDPDNYRLAQEKFNKEKSGLF